MTQVGTLVRDVGRLLAEARVPEAHHEARDLVAAVTGQGRFWPSLNAGESLDAGTVLDIQAAAVRRASGMPFAYAVGRAAFRHLTLRVTPAVLIPRQETELLVDLVLQHRGASGGTAADVGTGSGAIALALATEGRFDRVIGTDIASDVLRVARENAQAVQVPARTLVEWRAGDLLAPLRGERLDVLVSNPPYIAFDEARSLPRLVRDWEPSHALFSPGQGLDATRKIVAGAPALLCSGGLIALEVDCRRALEVVDLVAASGAFTNLALHRDLQDRDRFVLATRA